MSRDSTRARERSGSPSADADTGVDAVPDLDVGLDEDALAPAEEGRADAGPRAGETDGLRGRAAERAKKLFSPRRFLAALLLSVGGLLAADAFVPLPGSGLLGVLLATFLFGLAVEERRYAEAAVAGGVTLGASFLLDFAVVALLGGLGVPMGLLGGALGVAVGATGAYFGRDLRRGLTREVP